MPPDFKANDVEREIFQRELDSFVPDRVLDAHAHMWPKTALDPAEDTEMREWFAEDFPLTQMRTVMQEVLPGREFGGLLVPFPLNTHGQGPPSKELAKRLNDYVSEQAATDPLVKPGMFVYPEMEKDFLRSEVRRLGAASFKVYHSASKRDQTADSDIPEFLTEEHVSVADEFGLAITLHMVKTRAVADKGNQHWIRTFCEKYPNIKLILAHAARSFNPINAIEGVASLKGLQNVYFDTSAVNAVGAFEAIIEHMGHDRVLYGSDVPISHMRHYYVAVGMSMGQVTSESLGWTPKKSPIGPVVFNGIENLRALKQAAWHQRLTDSQVEDIFSNNLAGLLGIG